MTHGGYRCRVQRAWPTRRIEIQKARRHCTGMDKQQEDIGAEEHSPPQKQRNNGEVCLESAWGPTALAPSSPGKWDGT
eukprot:5045816-Pyramimonas_sp.AAC.1